MTEIRICWTGDFSKPIGLCTDTGAPRSVVGFQELDRIKNKWGLRNLKIKMSQNGFKFANKTYSSLGIVQILSYTPPGVPTIMVPLQIVQVDLPALIGLDIFDLHQLAVDTAFDH